jgi:hypothetical protein
LAGRERQADHAALAGHERQADHGRRAGHEHQADRALLAEHQRLPAHDRGAEPESPTGAEPWSTDSERWADSEPWAESERWAGAAEPDAYRAPADDPAPDRGGDTGGASDDDAGPSVAGVRRRDPRPDRSVPSRPDPRESAAAVDEVVAPDAAQASGRARPAAALAMVVGAAGAAVGSTMPWSTMTSGNETRTFSGVVVGDGRLVLVLAALVGAVALARLARRPFGIGATDVLIARLVAAGIIAVAAFDRMYGPPTLASFRAVSADQISIHPETGIMITLGSGALALIGAILLRASPRPRGGARGR